jgi:hypothetical protein
LTTVHAPWVNVAAQAVEYLQWLLEGKDVPAQSILPVQLSIGDTA